MGIVSSSLTLWQLFVENKGFNGNKSQRGNTRGLIIRLTETFTLYDGDVVLEFNPGNHRYYACIRGRKYNVTSVTTALDSLNKPALIPWAVNATLNYIRPAIAPGVEHAESYLETVYEKARRESTRIKREAADIGTQAHDILRLYPSVPRSGDGPALREEVQNCVAAGLGWLNSRDIQIIHQERPVYSRRYRYSGRFDILARVDGITSLIDYKSSKGIYPEYRFQTAAYVHALEEEFPEFTIEQRILIRLGKEDGVFEPHVYDRKSLRKDFNAFLAALKIYHRMREITKEEKHETT